MDIQALMKDKKVLYMSIAVVVIVLDVFIGLGMQCRSIFNYYKKCNERKQALVALRADMKKCDGYKKDIAEFNERFGKLAAEVTSEANVPALIDNISNLANDCGVEVTQLKPVSGAASNAIDVKGEKFQEIEFQILAEADFHEVGNFINRLETQKNFFRVVSLEVLTDKNNYLLQGLRLSVKSIVALQKK